MISTELLRDRKKEHNAGQIFTTHPLLGFKERTCMLGALEKSHPSVVPSSKLGLGTSMGGSSSYLFAHFGHELIFGYCFLLCRNIINVLTGRIHTWSRRNGRTCKIRINTKRGKDERYGVAVQIESDARSYNRKGCTVRVDVLRSEEIDK